MNRSLIPKSALFLMPQSWQVVQPNCSQTNQTLFKIQEKMPDFAKTPKYVWLDS